MIKKDRALPLGAIVEDTIGKVAERIAQEAKPSVGDLIKLLELKKSLQGEEPLHVTVKWVEEPANEK